MGKRRLPMSRLKELFVELKFADVETFIASGNVLFTSATKDTAKLESRIATHLERSLGYAVDTFVRSTDAVAEVAAAKVFPEDGRDGVTIHVAFLHREFPAEMASKLAAVRTADDEFRVIGREFYWLCRIRTSDSVVWTLPEMKALRLPTVTMRNLGSVRKLVAKHVA